MSDISTTKSPITHDPEAGSLPDLDEESVRSYSTTDSNDKSIGSDFDEEINQVTNQGKFFERDVEDDIISKDIVVSYHDRSQKGVRSGNPYISSIDEMSGLHVRRVNDVIAAAKKGPLYLFWLCLGRSFVKDVVLTATNRRLTYKGKDSVSETELNAFIGIEIMFSVLGVCRIRYMWRNSIFHGN